MNKKYFNIKERTCGKDSLNAQPAPHVDTLEPIVVQHSVAIHKLQQKRVNCRGAPG
jgi:hypothetical protein